MWSGGCHGNGSRQTPQPPAQADLGKPDHDSQGKHYFVKVTFANWESLTTTVKVNTTLLR